MTMHPEYEAARRRLESLIGYDHWLSQYWSQRWLAALAKDPTGTQCVRLVEDLEEQHSRMKE